MTLADVEEEVGEQLAQLDYQYNRQRHGLIEAGLERAIRNKLLEEVAAPRGLSVDELIAAEVDANVSISDDDITNFFQANEAALGGRSLEELGPRIREYLEQNERQRLLSEYARGLEEGRDIVRTLDPFRVELDNAGSPELGPRDAPVTLTEFSDFECPYCGQFFGTLKRLQEAYGDRLRIVYRQYPIDTHPNAFAAAQASLCAHDQGRFWQMHDLMFQEQDRLDEASLREKAERLGLDLGEYDACMTSDRHEQRIQRDIREGTGVGIDGTPALFVNGIPLAGGAVPYEVAVETIDEELARRGSN